MSGRESTGKRAGSWRWTKDCVVVLLGAAAVLSGCTGSPEDQARQDEGGPLGGPTVQWAPVTPLAEARILIEHNATDDDTGYQLFVDGDPWRRLTVQGPGGGVIEVTALGALTDFGLTEGFFETNEPPADEQSLEEILALFPEGEYAFNAESAEDGSPMTGVAKLTHAIPAEPEIRTPAEDAVVDPTSVLISWDPVTETIQGAPVTLVGYQVIVAKNVDAPPSQSHFKTELSVFLPPTASQVTVPDEFLEPGTPYEVEVLAIEESGNQTIGLRAFSTR